MSAVMVLVAVLIHTFSSGILAGAHIRYVTKTWSVVLLNEKKKYIYSYLKCIVYDKLLKPRQLFRITLYKFCPKIIQTITFHYCLACSHILWYSLETTQSSSRFMQLLQIHVSLII